jgi:hypothetical protein
MLTISEKAHSAAGIQKLHLEEGGVFLSQKSFG